MLRNPATPRPAIPRAPEKFHPTALTSRGGGPEKDTEGKRRREPVSMSSVIPSECVQGVWAADSVSSDYAAQLILCFFKWDSLN